MRHPSLRNLLDLSTGHLDYASREWLDRLAYDPEGGNTGSTQYGWFAFVPDEPEGEDEDTPAVMRGIFAFARTLSAAYILFDADAPELDDLATYEGFGNLIRPAAPAAG